jgi:hypothetical protein
MMQTAAYDYGDPKGGDLPIPVGCVHCGKVGYHTFACLEANS